MASFATACGARHTTPNHSGSDDEEPWAAGASCGAAPWGQLRRGRRQSAPARPEREGAEALKTVEIRGAKASLHPEIDGVYKPTQDSQRHDPVYRNARTNVTLVWCPQPPRWRITAPRGNGVELLAFADCPGARPGSPPPLPCQVPSGWVVVKRSQDGQGPDPDGVEGLQQAEPAVECVLVGKTVVVSGRSGHNQRLNGVFVELPENYGGFPAYVDKQKHLFIYRRPMRDAWVISNRLGPNLRSGRGGIFAEAKGDVPEPYLVRGPWTVHGIGARRPTEEDPTITAYLRAPESGPDAPPATQLSVRSHRKAEVAGNYVKVAGQLVNDHPLYRKETEAGAVEKFLFWDSERWCIGAHPSLKGRECEAASQRREVIGRNNPDDAVWLGVDVLRGGGGGRMDASLLAALRGNTSMRAKRFA